MQDNWFGDVQLKEQALGCLFSYNPFWLRLGLEVVTQRSVAQSVRQRSAGGSQLRGAGSWADQLHSFSLTHFFSDAEMMAEMEVQRGSATFDKEGFWVSGGWGAAGPRATDWESEGWRGGRRGGCCWHAL